MPSGHLLSFNGQTAANAVSVAMETDPFLGEHGQVVASNHSEKLGCRPQKWHPGFRKYAANGT